MLSFDARHADGRVDFAWHGTVTGTPEGVIHYRMDGTANTEFEYNRIGLCVLHPDDECAGQPYSGKGPDGPVSGRLPELVAPQPFEDGRYVPLIPPISELTMGLRSGGCSHLECEGELFETEDQRNWTDASYKTYGTPLALGFPHRAHEGQMFTQSVRLHATGVSAAVTARRSGGDVTLRIGPPTQTRLPMLGLGPMSSRELPDEQQLALLKALHPRHLRVDVHLDSAHWGSSLVSGLGAAEAIDCELEVAIFTRPGDALGDAAELLASARVARVLVFAAGAETATPNETTPAEALRRVRQRLGRTLPDVPIGGGTDMYFC
ncbi:MAG: hypothetical protein ACREXP_32025, partial [Steroidobacteraceae bacterium]